MVSSTIVCFILQGSCMSVHCCVSRLFNECFDMRLIQILGFNNGFWFHICILHIAVTLSCGSNFVDLLAA
jgi:hypothetical protein